MKFFIYNHHSTFTIILSSLKVSFSVPYSCHSSSICLAYLNLPLLYFISRTCSVYHVEKLRPVWQMHILLHSLHVNLYIPVLWYLSTCCFFVVILCLIVLMTISFISYSLNILVSVGMCALKYVNFTHVCGLFSWSLKFICDLWTLRHQCILISSMYLLTNLMSLTWIWH